MICANILAPLAELSTVALNDVFPGGSESIQPVKASTPGRRKAFDLLGAVPANMCPSAGWRKPANRFDATGNSCSCAVKCRLAENVSEARLRR